MNTNLIIPNILRAAIDENPEWLGKNVTCETVSGGITNENYRLTIDGSSPIFAKIPGAGTEKFINRETANQAARNAASAGISPEVLFFDPKSGIEFADFLEDGYRTATTLDFQKPEICKAVVDTYKAWHATEPLDETKTMIDMVEEHLQQIKDDRIELPIWAKEVIDNYRDSVDSFMVSGLEIVPAHNDPMPGNFLLGPDNEVRLIDFDYAANNEASYELGLILTEMFIDVDRSRELVSEYRGGFDEKFFARAMLCRMIADTKWGLWGLINAHARDEDFDYYKYGTWKLYRTFWIARHPEYRNWLEAAR